jgi:hypothetical protein
MKAAAESPPPDLDDRRRQPPPAKDPLEALLLELARHSEPRIRLWAERLLSGESASGTVPSRK